MLTDIRLLEDLVARAAERLQRLTEERDSLEKEVASLRRRLEASSAAREVERATDEAEGVGPGAWVAERERIAAALRETLSGLRGD